jgi:DNA-binding response OmpR family regulator
MGWRVLVVEDPLVGRLVDGILTRGGFEVVQADPQGALELMQDPSEKFSLVVTNTPDLFLNRASEFALLYLAASPDPQWIVRCPRCRALAKPFHPKDLLALALELVGAGSVTAVP